MNHRRHRLFSPNHYPIRPELCARCRKTEAAPGLSICSGCYQVYGYADFDPNVVKQKENQEAQWLKRVEWRPPAGMHTMSGAATALLMTVRGLYRAMERYSIVPQHNKGHAVITNAQLDYIGQRTRRYQKEIMIKRWDDGTIKITTKLAGKLIDDDPCSLNALARKGIVSGFIMEFPSYGGFAANRWQIDAVALENYLTGQQRREDAQHLRLGILRLCSSPYDQEVAEQTSGLLSSPPIVLRSNDARNEGETRLFQQP